MKKTVLTFGLIAGAILSAMMLITLPFHDAIGWERGEIVGYTSMVLAFLLVFFGVRSYRDNVGGGRVGFGRAFAVGSLIAVVPPDWTTVKVLPAIVRVPSRPETPFELMGAPWIHERELAEMINRANPPGVRVVPIRFTPTSSKHEGKECGGLNFVITDWDKFRSFELGLGVAHALRKLHRQEWDTKP